jgi:phosphoribosyl 1,2-cyclic phosphodiesterase
MKVRFAVLGSGSKGNAVYIENGSTAILVDCGFSGKELAARLGAIDRDIESLDAIFVTHEHHDHINGVGVVSRRCGIPVFANEGTFSGGAKRFNKLHRRSPFETGDTIEFESLQIRSFAVSHDTADPVGFTIGDGVRSVGLCTDTGIATRLIERRLSGCSALVLEFNHDPEMLKHGPYPQALKQRVRSSHGHLSNSDAAGLLNRLMHQDLRQVVLAHLSETNNLPEIAYREALRGTGERLENSSLRIAQQQQPTPLIELS